jgi:hypothetical protein
MTEIRQLEITGNKPNYKNKVIVSYSPKCFGIFALCFYTKAHPAIIEYYK